MFALRVSIARMPRATLFARTTTTTGIGLRSSICVSHAPPVTPYREAQRITAVASITSKRRISRCPRLFGIGRSHVPPVDRRTCAVIPPMRSPRAKAAQGFPTWRLKYHPIKM